ncbi:MAG: DUF1365 domain-containing protein [Comamonadaceae bacterium PBBC2]|nr:MAG: DUF1365 domain-containing protein [Comamonadaceae bacterium PBBC2]
MSTAGACIGWGQVRHTRMRPARHAFVYPTAFLMLPMRRLQAEGASADLAINRRAWFAFHDKDHGDGRPASDGGALAWLDELLHREGIRDAQGEVWLQAFPRVLGHAFKPVSFWYAHRPDGSLAAIVAEVNNTFGERHCYLLPAPQYGHTLRADKVFHVSPFCDVQGEYRFRFMRTQRGGHEHVVARVEHADADGPLIDTSWSGSLQPATSAALRQVMWRFPLLTLGVVARIHWHALLLWLKKVPFWRKPAPPSLFVTR